jgi:hypothetical protein
MVRIAKQSDPKRLEELKRKIRDERYLSHAINRIAHKLTEELVNRKGSA